MANCKIVISGYYGFNNAGDEAMLYSILRTLRESLDEPEVTVISGDPEGTAENFHIRAIPRFGGAAIAGSIFRSDVLVSGGGSLLQDVTSSRSLLYYLSIILMGVLFRKRVFLYSQGIGPLHRKWVCRLLSAVLSHVDAITVRDERSKKFLEQLGVSAPIYATADSVLSLPKVSLKEGREILSDAGVPEGKKIIGISVRDWMDADKWAKDFRAYIETLAGEGYEILFIPMQYPYDLRIARVISGEAKSVHFLTSPLSTPELMSVIGNLDLLIGMRLHALIFAALMHVPLIGISYDPKIDNFLSSIGKKAIFPISAFDAETLYNRTVEMLHTDIPEDEWDAVEALRQKACETGRILEKVLKK